MYTRLVRLGFVLLTVAYVLCAGLYSYLVPAWESPDEPAHYLYIQHLGTTGRPPGPNPVKRVGSYLQGGYVTSMYEWYHPALGYAWPALLWRTIDMLAPDVLPSEFPELSVGNPNANGFDRGLFMSLRDVPRHYQRVDIGLILLRFGSALQGLPVLWAIVYTGMQLYTRDNHGVILASVALGGLIPQFCFIMGTVRNDSANNMMSTLTIIVLLLLMNRKFEKPVRVACIAGLLLGLTMLTKSTASFLLPVALLALVFSPYHWVTRMKLAAALGLIALVIVGAYYGALPETRQAFAYNATHVKMNPELTNLPYVLSLLEPFRDMFWARFGWASIRVPPAWIWVSTIFSLVGMGTSAVMSFVKIKGSPLSLSVRKQVWFLFAVMLANLSLIVYYNLFITQPQGRFLFPSMLPFALLVFWGYFQLINLIKGKARTVVQWGVVAVVVIFLFSFNYAALVQSLMPAHYLL